MVRLSDLSEVERTHIMAKACEPFATQPWVDGPLLSRRRVALVTTAGIHRHDDGAFTMMDLSYRVLPGNVDTTQLSMTHSSVHFDRSGFREDINVVFPLDRLREMAVDGEVGSVANYHYSLMGAGWLPEQIKPTAEALAALLHADNVDAVCLIPV
jgi:D-proline reductase (dithiol) PrdB